MNKLTESSNLTKYIVEPVKKNLDKKLDGYCYYDIGKEDELTTNKKGVDIISHQLELRFEGNTPIFISWATIDGWFQYSLCISESSFCSGGVETFIKEDIHWPGILGRTLKQFEVYGYKENVIASKEGTSGRVTEDTYDHEPHLVVLYFDNGAALGVGNFYLEDNFDPKFPMGDDIWIVFGRNYIDSYINKLSLENLDI